MSNLNYPTKESIERLVKDLNLVKGDSFTQEWECEAADVNRIEDFLSYYESAKLNSNEKVTLMRLILESYNDYVCEFGYNAVFACKLKRILENEKTFFKDVIEYWSCGDEELEDCFAITSFMREIRDR